MTLQDREAVAQILALPDGPWEFSPGHATGASFFAGLAAIESHNRGCRGRRELKAMVDESKRRKPQGAKQ